MRRLFLLLITITTLLGCNRSFALFPFELHRPDEVVEVPMREIPGRPGDGEGYLRSEGTAYELQGPEPAIVPEGRQSLVVRLSRAASGVQVVVRDPNGAEIARGAAPRFPPGPIGEGRVAFAVPVPAGVTVASVGIHHQTSSHDRGGTDQSQVPPRLHGISVEPSRRGAGFLSDGTWFLAPRVQVSEWGDGATERRWSVRPDETSGWDMGDPVEIRYRMPAPARLSVEELAVTTDVPIEMDVPRATLHTGGAAFDLQLRPGEQRVILYPDVEGIEVEEIRLVSKDPDVIVEWIAPLDGIPDGSQPVPLDLGTLRRYPVDIWRQPGYEVFTWTMYPQVLIVDSLDYAVQSRFFKRLAFFVEKRGYRGTILSDDELAGRHGYNAHNYSAAGLASFFQAAEQTGTALNAEEQLLREIVIANGIIRTSESGYEAVEGGVLAVSQESAYFPTLRDLLLSHEAYHGVYYAEPRYVDAIDVLWESLDSEEQRYWELLLSGMQYDTSDEYLLRNEYHAYLLQQPPASATWYFESRSVERIARWIPSSSQWLRDYVAEYSGSHRLQAARAQVVLNSLTGLLARDVYCLEPF